MPSKDIFHNAVKNALVKDGWTITHDPLFIRFAEVELYIDLGAEPVIAATKAHQQIAVEIKSFVRASMLSEFHTALGQFLNYKVALEKNEPERILYLAVPLDAYEAFFSLQFAKIITQRFQLNLLVYNVKTEEIVTWQA